jgi:hypothetical protein
MFMHPKDSDSDCNFELAFRSRLENNQKETMIE